MPRTDPSERIRIGHRIRELREAAGMSQEQLSAASGVNRSHVSQIESGKHSTSLDLLAKLAKALGASVEIIKN